MLRLCCPHWTQGWPCHHLHHGRPASSAGPPQSRWSLWWRSLCHSETPHIRCRSVLILISVGLYLMESLADQRWPNTAHQITYWSQVLMESPLAKCQPTGNENVDNFNQFTSPLIRNTGNRKHFLPNLSNKWHTALVYLWELYLLFRLLHLLFLDLQGFIIFFWAQRIEATPLSTLPLHGMAVPGFVQVFLSTKYRLIQLNLFLTLLQHFCINSVVQYLKWHGDCILSICRTFQIF